MNDNILVKLKNAGFRIKNKWLVQSVHENPKFLTVDNLIMGLQKCAQQPFKPISVKPIQNHHSSV